MYMVSFLVSILNLAVSSRLWHLSISSSVVDVSGLVSGLDSEPGSELPFATPVDQIEPGSIEFKLLPTLDSYANLTYDICG